MREKLISRANKIIETRSHRFLKNIQKIAANIAAVAACPDGKELNLYGAPMIWKSSAGKAVNGRGLSMKSFRPFTYSTTSSEDRSNAHTNSGLRRTNGKTRTQTTNPSPSVVIYIQNVSPANWQLLLSDRNSF